MAARAKPKATKPKIAPQTSRRSRAVPVVRKAVAFEAGKTGRRLKAIPATATAINSLIRQYGRNVVARSRYLATNNAYAAMAKDAYVSALVGAGIKPSSLIADKTLKKAIAEAFRDWTDEADADALTDFYGVQNIIASEMFEAGECFVRIRERRASDGLTVPLQLQVLPSEMLPTYHNVVLPGGSARIECGIEFDAIGKRTAYHFLRNHPGESLAAQSVAAGQTVRVPADEVLHLFRPIRAGQIRGVPHTLAGLITLALIDLYDDAELERKRTAALFGAFTKREAPKTDEEDIPLQGAPATTNADGLTEWGLEPGAVIDLEPGQDVAFAEPADVGATYEPFQYRNLLRAAAGFGVPYSDMTGDLRQTSYGSIRAGLVAFRRRIEAQQHHVMIFQFCRPVWNRWLKEAVLAGAIPVTPATFAADPTLRRVKWIPPKWDWIDPLKDRQAEKLAVDSGFKPRSDVIEAEGYDPEEVDARIAQDQQRAKSLGLRFIQLPSSVIVAPADEEPSLVDNAILPADDGAEE